MRALTWVKFSADIIPPQMNSERTESIDERERGGGEIPVKVKPLKIKQEDQIESLQ